MAELVLYRYLGGLSDDHQQVSALSMSDGAVCGRWCRKRDSQGTTKNRRVLCRQCLQVFMEFRYEPRRVDISTGTAECGETTYIVQSADVGGCRECSS